MKLNRNKIFLGILILSLAADLLVIFNIQTLYLRAVFSFVFLMVIPGLLIMLILKFRRIGFWKYSVFVIGLSAAFVMFAGLAVNWANSWAHDKMARMDSRTPVCADCGFTETELPLPVSNIWVAENDILYGYDKNKIVKSADNGATWNPVYKFTEGEGNRRVFVDSRGTIFASRDNTGKMYMSRGGDNNWTATLSFVCQNKVRAAGQPEGYGSLWSIDEDSQGNLYVGEYGGVWDANCAYIHKSADGGLTWNIVYDSLAYGWSGRHIHLLKVDPANDYIYASQGDGYGRARLIRSTDSGRTWTMLEGKSLDAQFTTMVIYSGKRLFGTDSGNLPNKVVRTGDDRNFSSAVQFKAKINEFVWSSSKNSAGVAYFGTVSEDAGGTFGLYKTDDQGDSWQKIKGMGTTTEDFQGIDSISNFDSEGYAYYHDNLNRKTYRYKDTSKPDSRLMAFLKSFKMLSLMPVLISFNFILWILAMIAYRRSADLEFRLKLPDFSALDRTFLLIPLIFPVLSVSGAIVLNNNGSNALMMAMFGGVAVYAFFAIYLRDRLNANIFPWAVLNMSLALLLSGWLRSRFVSGADINLEYHIFQTVKNSQYWSMSLFDNAYTACLSVSILPVILSLFLDINDQYIFKLIMPLIFSITPVCVYLLMNRYTQSAFAFLAAFFFMSQSVFLSWWWIPIRQEAAFLFFTLALLALFSRTIGPARKNFLFLACSFAMVVSHYSTTYIALALFIFTYLLSLLLRLAGKSKFLANRWKWPNGLTANGENKTHYHLHGAVVILVVLFAVFWYAQLTKISGDFVDFTRKTAQNFGNIFSEDMRSEGSSLGEQWNIFRKPKEKQVLLDTHITGLEENYNISPYIKKYDKAITDNYRTSALSTPLSAVKVNQAVAKTLYFGEELIQKIMKIFIVFFIFFIFYLMFVRRRRINIDFEYMAMALGGLLMMAAMMILPFASIDYDILRQYQQLLVILSLPAVSGGLILFGFIRNLDLKISAVTGIFLLYFLFLSDFIPQILGGKYPPLQLNNAGGSHDELYIHDSEARSADWLFANRPNDEFVYADARAAYKLWFASYIGENKIIGNVFPSLMDKNAYVYSSYANTLKNMAYINLNGNLINYNFPSEFLDQNKNLIYSNGESEIYK